MSYKRTPLELLGEGFHDFSLSKALNSRKFGADDATKSQNHRNESSNRVVYFLKSRTEISIVRKTAIIVATTIVCQKSTSDRSSGLQTR